MERPRWPDTVIVLGIVALAVVGVMALWGHELAALVAGGDPPSPPGPGPQIGGDRL